MSLNHEIKSIRGRMSLLKGIVLDNLTEADASYSEQWAKYEVLKSELDKLVKFRSENPIRHVRCEKPWSREFFGHFPGSYEFCQVLEMWLDSNDEMVTCLAQRRTGEQFFAVPKYNHFGQVLEHENYVIKDLWPYHRNKYREFLERTCQP